MESRDSNSFSILEENVQSPTSNLTNETDETDSLPSTDTHSSLDAKAEEDDDEPSSDAEREWRESLQQLELMLTIVVVPYIGKYFGRKCAYWGWAKIMEWKHPNLELVVTNPTLFKAAGAAEVAASL